MADLTQSSSTVSTAAPSYYTDYLSNLASKGTAAGAGVSPAAWDPNALQNQAFTGVASNVGNYQPGLTTAGQTFGQAGSTDVTGAANPYLAAGTTTSGLTQANPYLTSGTSSSADLVGGYMNPYTSNVVDQIRLANQQNIQQNLSPGITAGAVGGGQFGSQRGANALALGISNANIGALGKQAEALQAGYTQALTAAQKQRENQLQAGQTAGTLQNQFNTNQVTAGQVAGNMAAQEGQLLRDVGTGQASLANQQQTQGLADVNALATLGGQQQTIAQNRALLPLDVLSKQAALMSGAQLPMTTTSTMTGSPLSAIAGLGALGVGMFQNTGSVPVLDAAGKPVLDAAGKVLMTPGKSPASNIGSTITDLWKTISGGGAAAGGGFQAADGNTYPTQAEADAATNAYFADATGGGGGGGAGGGAAGGGNDYGMGGGFQAADGNSYATQAEADAATNAYFGDFGDINSGNSGGNFGGGFGDGTTETPTLGAGSWEQDQDGTWTFVPA